MKKYVNIASSTKGIRRFRQVFSDPRVRQEIGIAGAGPVISAARRLVPVGKIALTRYAPRKVKGKRNKPSIVIRTTKAGNLASSQGVQSTKTGARVGVRSRPGGGTYAEYSFVVHQKNPWLARAAEQSRANSQSIMMMRVRRLIKSLNL